MLLEIDRDERENVLRVKVEGDLDINSVRRLKKELEENIAAHRPNIRMDCAALQYIDSTGLGTLVSALKSVREYGGSIRIERLKPYLNKIFEVTGLTKLFDIEVAE